MNNNRFKFRVWDLKKKKWFRAVCVNSYLIELTPPTFSLPFEKKYIIQQFTGLKDKNGREIYEGDILFWAKEEMMKNNTPILYSKNYKAVVKYVAPNFILEELTHSCPVFWSNCSIIGNIFENSEILNAHDGQKTTVPT